MPALCQIRRAAVRLGIIALLLVLIVPAGTSAALAELVPLNELLRPDTSSVHRDDTVERSYTSISLTAESGRAPPAI